MTLPVAHALWLRLCCNRPTSSIDKVLRIAVAQPQVGITPPIPMRLQPGCRTFCGILTPDEQLLAAAERNELATAEDIERHARRMVNDPRADQAQHEFLHNGYVFDRVLSATRDRRRYREFNAEIAGAMVEETQRLFDHLVKNDRNFMELMTADYTFINVPLARLYGLPEPTSDFDRVDYPAHTQRSGILGHGTFLVSTSKPGETSPTARGLFYFAIS